MQVIEANGARIPVVGLGTWNLRDEVCTSIVGEALRGGYRHVDTAAMYGNEEAVGEGIRGSAVAREDIFLTTKVWPDDLAAKDFRRSVEHSLKKLKLPYVDLILIHWPSRTVPLAETLKAMAAVKRDGLARHVGISNFTLTLIEEAVKLSSEPLVVNQVEMHPFLDQSKIVAASRQHGLAVTAYCPIARGNSAGDKILARIGAQHGKSAAQISLRYLVQQGIIVIPRTSKRERLKENMDIFDFTLSEAEMAEIKALGRRDGRMVSPGAAPDWD
jgi:diketogulonate reductase-like aldo/keto reductase